MLKSSTILFLLSILVLSCKKTETKNISTIEVSIVNHKSLDSLIIYDKENSWEKKTTLRFKNSKSIIDTLDIKENKLYQVYMFLGGNQKELGELLISTNSNVMISIDENSPYNSIEYNGNFDTANNFIAFSNKHQNQLTEMVRNGIEQAPLETQINEKGNLINEKGVSLKVVDSLKLYVAQKFEKFSDILKKKNLKYLYKNSLINKIGNHFSFTDINNQSKSLADFNGKYIYIDVWATWCKPCKVEYTYLKKLEEHFSNEDKLQIISISTDSDVDEWKNYITKHSIEGIQLYSGSNSGFVKFYDIGALPRFIFLDMEGKIINPDEIRPSNPKLLEILESTVNNNPLDGI